MRCVLLLVLPSCLNYLQGNRDAEFYATMYVDGMLIWKHVSVETSVD